MVFNAERELENQRTTLNLFGLFGKKMLKAQKSNMLIL